MHDVVRMLPAKLKELFALTAKKTQATPKTVIKVCQQRLRDYDALTEGV